MEKQISKFYSGFVDDITDEAVVMVAFTNSLVTWPTPGGWGKTLNCLIV
jgi:hypothetical protein